jgi:uncharacterized protein with PQ loop repeat
VILHDVALALASFVSHVCTRSALESAATLAVITSGLPQLWSLVRGGDGRGISIPTWVVIFSSGLLWGAYGYQLHDSYMIVTNAFVSCNAAAVATLVLFRRRASGELLERQSR